MHLLTILMEHFFLLLFTFYYCQVLFLTEHFLVTLESINDSIIERNLEYKTAVSLNRSFYLKANTTTTSE